MWLKFVYLLIWRFQEDSFSCNYLYTLINSYLIFLYVYRVKNLSVKFDKILLAKTLLTQFISTSGYEVSTDLKDFSSARDDCKARGGDLAKPMNSLINAHFAQMIQKKVAEINWDGSWKAQSHPTWINVNLDQSNKPTHQLPYENWQQGEPNQHNDYCVIIKTASDKESWADRSCSDAYPYICQFTGNFGKYIFFE